MQNSAVLFKNQFIFKVRFFTFYFENVETLARVLLGS